MFEPGDLGCLDTPRALRSISNRYFVRGVDDDVESRLTNTEPACCRVYRPMQLVHSARLRGLLPMQIVDS